MNSKRRNSLRDVLRALANIEAIVESICDKEEECVDNYPENLQSTEQFERIEDAVDNLNNALEMLGDAREYIEAAIEGGLNSV